MYNFIFVINKKCVFLIVLIDLFTDNYLVKFCVPTKYPKLS